MIFSSITFLFYFLPIFLIAYLISRNHHGHKVILLSFSLFFYAWGEPLYIVLMLFSIFINWLFGKLIAQGSDKKRKKVWLVFSLSVNLGMLAVFKYTPFIVSSVEQILSVNIPYGQLAKKIPLPIGISFYTFQAVSYIIDVYRKRIPHEPNIILLGTYISMFPQLIAGPIVRYEKIKKELHNTIIEYASIIKGAQLFIIGLASKILIADAFAKCADYIFSLDAHFISAPLAWIGSIAYFFQIYFDFNGYSVMAIGLGKILGFTFPRNFNRPYISKNITEFWRRWHISLTSWFRDYLYIPLGGNRRGLIITYRNLFIVFILCGLWHGAAWNFLIWGIFHGSFLVLERMFRGRNLNFPLPVKHIYTLSIILFGWVIFRCESLSHLTNYLMAMFGFCKRPAYSSLEFINIHWICLFLLAMFLSTIKLNYNEPLFVNKPLISGLCYSTLFSTCIIVLVCGTFSPFIYFRF